MDDPTTWHWTDQWFQQNVGTQPTEVLTHFVVPGGPSRPSAWCGTPIRR
ncbi:hypothetical protein [Kitasatospora sp. NPDC059827]